MWVHRSGAMWVHRSGAMWVHRSGAMWVHRSGAMWVHRLGASYVVVPYQGCIDSPKAERGHAILVHPVWRAKCWWL